MVQIVLQPEPQDDRRPQPSPQPSERLRLQEDRAGLAAWKYWGPYLSERQWGTVREDYSPHGNAWEYFAHDQARARAYRWGEDGIAGISDERQRLCLALGLWNGEDPILKERLFGLTNGEGNHSEDVKELYYYLDATPTHSYLKFLYKYPQSAFPYGRLVEENRRRGKDHQEFELVDAGVFDDDRYFDVSVEYAKGSPEDILMKVTAANRGPDPATIHVLPQLWFRNTWSWREGVRRPGLYAADEATIGVRSKFFGDYRLFCDGEPELLFTDNDTNTPKLYGTDAQGFFKDGFDDYVVHGNAGAVNPERTGTKAGALYRLEVPAGGSAAIRLRLTTRTAEPAFEDFDEIAAQRKADADAFYADLQADLDDPDARAVQRQAFAGMIWSKQFFYFDILEWLTGDPTQPAPPDGRRHGRNAEWKHLNNADIISMPDKWEYPWYAAWDLAFHCLPLALVDAEFAKQQLVLLTREWYMHPNGQMPAYEWAFGDVNPPVHAWATWRVFQIDRKQRGDDGDIAFLERVFHKLMLNFTWWVNRKDAQGRNIFQGGFLGLDNIGVFDRSSPLPTGGFINQADGTAWMAMYSLNLMTIALELARHNHVYEDIATKFFEHFLGIAEAMTNIGDAGVGLWDEEDQFFYDVLNLPDGRITPLKVRSMVGLIPLFAVETLDPDLLEELPDFTRRLKWYLKYRPDLCALVSRWQEPGLGERRLLSLLRGHRMKALLRRLLDETEFLSDYGVRALSKVHEDQPYVYHLNGDSLVVRYQPAESDSGLFGGNSNWRGPIWFPVNFLLIESLQKFHHYYGDDFKVECPTGSGNFITIEQVAEELSRRLTHIFLRDGQGRRAVFGDHPKLQNDPHFRDHLLFYEYFHGDTARGVGAAHQTGWTGLIAKLLQPRRRESGQPQPRTISMRTMTEDEDLPPVVMPSCEIRKTLAGQKALVTGANSGIGKGVAIALGKAGAEVVVNYVARPEQAEEVVAAIRGEGGSAYAHQADVSQEDQVQAMFAWMCDELGTIDILVNNAGLQRDARLEEMTLKDWNAVIGVNLTGQFLCAREAVKEFKRRGVRPEISCAAGKIVCVSSVHEVIPWAGHVNYAASKGGVMLMMKSIAQETAPYRIRVNSVCPGAIRTPINTAAWSTPEAHAALMKLVPYNRIGEVEDIGRVVAWLASDEADYITGASIFVDGGMTLYPGFETGG